MALTSPLIRTQLQNFLGEKGAATSSTGLFQQTISAGVGIAENLHEIFNITY
jgi:hypothetical protein